MKSLLFAAIDPNLEENKHFARDLRVLLRLSPQDRDLFSRAMLDISRTFSKVQDKEIIERLAQDTKLGLPDVNFALGALSFLVIYLSRDEFQEDAPDDLAEDLRDLGVVKADQAQQVAQIITHIKDRVIPQYKKIKQTRTTAGGVLPCLRSLGTTVELRPIIEPTFKFGMSLKKYEPKIVNQVTVVSVHLSVDSGPVKEFVFQVLPDELEIVIKQLQVALMNVEVLEKRFPVSEGKKKSKKKRKATKKAQ